MHKGSYTRELNPLQLKINKVIFGWDTTAGKRFDIILIIIILVSILFVMLETVPFYETNYKSFFRSAEWVITVFFTFEYILRLYCSKQPFRYMFSFYGLVDFVSILPAYLSLYFVDSHELAIIRSLRLLRGFKIFEMSKYTSEGVLLLISMRKSFPRITVFLAFILILTSILGSILYVIEGRMEDTGFTSIPNSMYWAIATLSTVGYGDITPVTAAGKFIASMIMILGYAVIAVPTGIVAADAVSRGRGASDDQEKDEFCQECGIDGHKLGAEFCYQCGANLNEAN